jgi:hypothetical protein
MELLAPRPLKVANWLMLGFLVLLSLLWGGREFALGVLVGGVVVIVNFHLLHRALQGAFQGPVAPEEGSRAKAYFAGRQLLRFFALLAIIYLLVRHAWVNIFGLLVGLSTVVLTLTLTGIYEMIKLRKKEANPSHGTSHPVS